MIITADILKNGDKKVIMKQFMEEYRRDLEAAQAKVIHTPYVSVPITDPPWIKLKKEQDDKYNEARHWLKLDALDFFVTRYELQHVRIDYGQRVENPRTGDYVDWWVGKKQRMRRVNGEFCHQGINQKNLFRELVMLAIL